MMNGVTDGLGDAQDRRRLLDEMEQMRTALEAKDDEIVRLAQDRDRLLRRITSQARDLQAAEAAYSTAANQLRLETEKEALSPSQPDGEQEELRVAFEELQVLTEELEVANTNLHQANKALDGRVKERTRELEAKNFALTESELRFRTLVEGIPQLVWRAVDGGSWTWASPQWVDYTGQSEADSRGHGWLRALHPDDRDQARAAWVRAEAAEPLEMQVRVFHRAESRYRHFQIRATAVRTDEGNLVEWLGTSTDIDDLRASQERQQVLLAELQHRVRNILTVVRSVFGRTVEAGGDAQDVADHFRGRLDSLARTQVMVTRHADGLVDLEDLVRDELLSVGAHDGPNLTITGPDVALHAKAAEAVGLAIHELTTNALKYGALCVPNASLHIGWTINMDCGEGRRLDLKWEERGVPAVDLKPARKGFGSELITEALPYRLGAETSLVFRGGGVCCTLSMPLPDEGALAAPVM